MFTEKRILSILQFGWGLGYMILGAVFLSLSPEEVADKVDWEMWKWFGFGIAIVMSYVHQRTAYILLK